ncbi:MAG: DNA repair protein RecN [Magnetospirillum sp.]|nr:DNA repair protein RecN [Magnetospirillum sp.]
MLVSLSIRDVVLIERLDLSFGPSLSAFTGETGAGKSILLDSLSLALGARADAGLVRHGTPQLSVTAAFALPDGHIVPALLDELGIGSDGQDLVLRRIVAADGRSRAFVNDQPVSVGMLRRIGDGLVEIHGQFESHGLLDPASHLGILDAFGGLGGRAASVNTAWHAWREAARVRAEAEAGLVRARAEEGELRAAYEELHGLDPKPGEEARLAESRSVMMHGEKLVEAMNAAMAALSQRGDVEASLRNAQRALERVAERAEGRLSAVIAALDRAAVETAEAVGLLERASADISLDPRALETAEERLFALRAAARKHGTDADGLARLHDDLALRLAQLDSGGDGLANLIRTEQAARTAYVEAARTLSREREEIARALDAAVAAELPPLKLDRAVFRTRIAARDEDEWGPAGLDAVEFLVATNPGAPPGPLGKIASGGELARFMLALKVILARVSTIPTIVFDEVDSGIGGAVAAAVGERLARLAEDVQVLVVTHSPQVAARGARHYRVAKRDGRGESPVTTVESLDGNARREEVARMLSGETVTQQARAAADSLLAGL